MKTSMMTVAIIAALTAAPAFAKEEKALKDEGMKQSSSISQENMSREQNPDGTFQGKPVVQGPADWSDIGPASASTGASSGEAGSASDSGSSKN